jgi:hypothetical protein
VIHKEKHSNSSIKAMVKHGGLVTDREWPVYLFGLTRDENEDWFIRKVYGYDLNAITLDMLNAVTHKLSEWWRDELDETGTMPQPLTKEEFDDVLIDGAIQIIIRESEIRQFLKRPNYSKKFIHDHMDSIGTIALKGIAPTQWSFKGDEGKYGWKNKPVTGGFAEVICVNDPEHRDNEKHQRRRLPPREKGRWKDTEEYVYVVRFIGEWGKSFAASVLNKRIKMMPERFYRYLSPTAKMLFRVIGGTDYSPITLTLDQCSKILGWKPETTNMTLRITLISRALEGLVKYYFVSSFKSEPKGKPTTHWVIWKKKNWFYPPELKE